MFEALFGAEMPLAVRFFLAFLIVLGLIGAAAWAVRRFGAGRLGAASMRGRQPRLAVVDYASVDARRRLLLIRRDNVEHLVMIGGPSDLVVESNIVRAAPAAREVTVARPPAAMEMLPRAIPLPETGNGSWPLQPEPMGLPRSGPRMESEEPTGWPLQQHGEAPPRPPRETLAALADEIAARPVPPRNRAGSPRTESRVPPVQPAEPEAAAGAADQSLAEMAHRLEAALRKPKPAAEGRPPAPARPAPPSEQAAEATEAAAPRPPRTARTEAKAKEGKALYDSLEQEMASLLGRPASKT